MRRLADTLRGRPGGLRGELLLGLALKGGGAVSSFVFTWVAARAYGAGVVGLLQIGLATMALASLVAVAGLDTILVRTVSVALRRGDRGAAAQLYRRALRVVVPLAGALALVIALLAAPFAGAVLDQPAAAPYLALLAPGVLFLAVVRIAAAVLRSSGAILRSQTLDGIFYTSIAAIVVGGAWLLGRASWPLLPPLAYVAALAVAAVVAWRSAHRLIAPWGDASAALPVLSGAVIAAILVVSQGSDWGTLMIVTAGRGPADAGIYRVAFQVCMLFLIVNTSFAVMAGPHLAAAAAADDRAGVARIIRTAGATGLALCLPLAVATLAVPGFLLGLFGPEFVAGAPALRLLTVAQMVNVGFGPVGTALMMMHRERLVLGIELVAAGAVVLVAWVAIGRYGIVGAAAAALTGSVIRNGASCAGVLWGNARLGERTA